MKSRALFASVLVLAGCGGGSTAGPVGSEGSACHANGTCDAGLACVASVCVADSDAGNGNDGGTLADSGSGADSGIMPTGSCLDTDTDTGTYTLTWYTISTKTPHFNIDGVGDENLAGGCGITDLAASTDNGFRTMATDMITTMGLEVDVVFTDALEAHNNGGDIVIDMVFTHVRSDILTNFNDDCVGVRFDVSRGLAAYPSTEGEGAIVNRRFQGALDGPLGLHFPMGAAYPGKVLHLEVRDPVLDLAFNTSFTGLNQANSYVGGYLFWAPPAGNAAAYSGFQTFDATLLDVAGSLYTTMLKPYIPDYLDLHMEPTGERTLCSPTAAPNSLAITFQISAN